jgi:hypothetical protein
LDVVDSLQSDAKAMDYRLQNGIKPADYLFYYPQYKYLTNGDWLFYNGLMRLPGNHFLPPNCGTNKFLMARLKRFHRFEKDLLRDGKCTKRLVYWAAAIVSELIVRGVPYEDIP